MIKNGVRIEIPNPHHGQDIGSALLAQILRDIGISADTFEDL